VIGQADSRKDAPFDDKSWEIWGLPWDTKLRRVDRLFDMYDHQVMVPDKSYLKKAEKSGVVLYMREPICRRSKKFPLDEIIEAYFDDFSCTLCYMVALAIYEGVDEIGLWGIDMEKMGEYETQRPAMYRWLGLAQGLGIKITIPPASPRLKPLYQYGRDVLPIDFSLGRTELLTALQYFLAKSSPMERELFIQNFKSKP